MWGFKPYIKRIKPTKMQQRFLCCLLFVSIFSFNSYSQSEAASKKVSGILATGGELSFIQNVLSGGANFGILLNASFYYQLTPKWEAGLGGDLLFGNVMGSRAIHINVRRNFKRSFLSLKGGLNQGVFTQPQLLNTRYQPRHFFALGYTVRFGKFLAYSELLQKRFVALTTANENTFSTNIDAFGIRIGIGLEL